MWLAIFPGVRQEKLPTIEIPEDPIIKGILLHP